MLPSTKESTTLLALSALLATTACSSDESPSLTGGAGSTQSGTGNRTGERPLEQSAEAIFENKEGARTPGYTAGACTLEAVALPFEDPQASLHWSTADLPFSDYSHAIMSPVVVDFIKEEGDPIPEIIFISYRSYSSGWGDGVMRVVSGRAPHETLLTIAGDGSPANSDSDTAGANFLFDAHPSAADLDGDDTPEVVALLQNGGLQAVKSDGSALWTTSSTDAPRSELRNGAVAIADLEGDGTPEVVVGRSVFDGRTGALRWRGSAGRGRNGQGPLSCVADLDQDGSKEIIAGNTVYTANGSVLWQVSGTGDGFCAVADIVNNDTGAAGKDGVPEVVRVSSGSLYLHETRTADNNEGRVIWSRALPACNSDGLCNACETGNGGAPTVADFDGDGQAEVGVAGTTCYSVFDPECASSSTEGCVENGVRWARPTEDNSSHVTSSTVFDFNGDRTAEVVYNDEHRFLVLDGRSGDVVYWNWNPSRTRTEQPVVADVDNDGNADIVFVANSEAGFAGDQIPNEHIAAERIPGIEIWSSGDDAWVGARPVWNQHTYHIDNITAAGTLPSPEPASWLTHNTYRLNLAEEDPLAAPDLTSAGGGRVCDGSKLALCVQLQNAGDVRVGPGVEVTFYSGNPSDGGIEIGKATSKRNVEAGTVGEVVCITANNSSMDVYAQIDTNDRECNADNNLVNFNVTACQTSEVQ